MMTRQNVVEVLDWLTTAKGVSFLVGPGDGSWQEPDMAAIEKIVANYWDGDGEEDEEQ